MTARDEVPAEIRQMKTSELVRIVSEFRPMGIAVESILIGYRLTERERAEMDRRHAYQAACAAELDRRIPSSEGT